MRKVICIVQARMSSERLPGKVLKPILGKPMIEYTLQRLAKARYIDELVLATSAQKTDDPLAEYVQAAGFKVFRGNEHHVLERYKMALDQFGADVVVRVTGDCPLIDPELTDSAIARFLCAGYDYLSLNPDGGFIRGFDTEVFTAAALDKAYKAVGHSQADAPNREHVTPYIYRNPNLFKCEWLKADSFYRKKYRLCVDTADDFEIVMAIYKHFQDMFVSAGKAVQYLDDHPDIAAINAEVTQKLV